MVCGVNLAKRMSVHPFSQILTDPDSCSAFKFQKIEEKVQHIQYVQSTYWIRITNNYITGLGTYHFLLLF